jgi:hypothetical protein
MSTFKINRVTALPGTLEANSVYLVSSGSDYVEMYVTGNTAAARRIHTEADIQALIDASIAGMNSVTVVDDIAARDALSFTANATIYVIDATGDSSVDAGGATYMYRLSTNGFIKVSESESMDVSLAWASLIGGPASDPANIDAAVANSHTHANKTQLDKVGENVDGDITYNGNEYVRSGAESW